MDRCNCLAEKNFDKAKTDLKTKRKPWRKRTSRESRVRDFLLDHARGRGKTRDMGSMALMGMKHKGDTWIQDSEKSRFQELMATSLGQDVLMARVRLALEHFKSPRWIQYCGCQEWICGAQVWTWLRVHRQETHSLWHPWGQESSQCCRAHWEMQPSMPHIPEPQFIIEMALCTCHVVLIWTFTSPQTCPKEQTNNKFKCKIVISLRL